MALPRLLTVAAAILLTIWLALPAGATQGRSLCGVERWTVKTLGACLNPAASDYDCAGGSGNGPYYTGPVRVVGPDHFGLDRDGDGYACKSS
jgi:hypothetical protein